MKYVVTLLASCALAGCIGGGSGSGAQTTMNNTLPSGAPISSPHQGYDRSFDGMLNGVRAQNGAGTLNFDARLARAAQTHSNDMLAMGRLTHTGSDGSDAGQRIRREGYVWRTWGENVAQGYQTEEDVLNGWVNSPGHQANNINPAFEDFGLAKAGSGSSRYWTLVLAAEQ